MSVSPMEHGELAPSPQHMDDIQTHEEKDEFLEESLNIKPPQAKVSKKDKHKHKHKEHRKKDKDRDRYKEGKHGHSDRGRRDKQDRHNKDRREREGDKSRDRKEERKREDRSHERRANKDPRDSRSDTRLIKERTDSGRDLKEQGVWSAHEKGDLRDKLEAKAKESRERDKSKDSKSRDKIDSKHAGERTLDTQTRKDKNDVDIVEIVEVKDRAQDRQPTEREKREESRKERERLERIERERQMRDRLMRAERERRQKEDQLRKRAEASAKEAQQKRESDQRKRDDFRRQERPRSRSRDRNRDVVRWDRDMDRKPRDTERSREVDSLKDQDQYREGTSGKPASRRSTPVTDGDSGHAKAKPAESKEEPEEEEESSEAESVEEEEEAGSGTEESSSEDSDSDSGSESESGSEGEDGHNKVPAKSKFEGNSEEESESEAEDEDKMDATEYLSDSPPQSPVELKPELPPYLPAIEGCRNVDDFQCLNRIEEGTYGVVYRALDKKTNETVALKRLKMEKEKEGFPITSLREISTILKAQHQNIVTVREIVVGSNMDKIYIVMDYVEHDLKSLMETMKQPFLVGETKTLMLQLLRAVDHLHDNWILHRDLKTSNLLLSHKGILKVGDFGLAREYGSPLKPYTQVVVTLWYRAPELLLGCKEYATKIDMWSVGCIFAEFLTMKPLFPGKSEIDQLNRIFKDLGTPNEKIWPGVSKLPHMKKCSFAEYQYNTLRNRFGSYLTDKGFDLLNKFLTYDPSRRISAETALKHEYFKEAPQPIPSEMFPTWPAKSEGGRKHGNTPKPPSGGKAAFAGLLGDDDLDQALASGGAGFHLQNASKGISAGPVPGFSLKF